MLIRGQRASPSLHGLSINGCDFVARLALLNSRSTVLPFLYALSKPNGRLPRAPQMY